MTEHEKRIREALEAEPTEGPWFEHHDKGRLYIENQRDDVVCHMGLRVKSNPTSQFIAACNPSAIRALLADLDAVRAKAARYDFLRGAHWSNAALCCVLDPKANVRLGAMCPTGENLDCLIDAALKGASHE